MSRMFTRIQFGLLIGAILGFGSVATAQEGQPCSTVQVNQKLFEQNPEFLKDRQKLFENNRQVVQTKGGDEEVVFTIPIVFHVLHDYGEGNISFDQIYDQMDFLNEDFQKLNSDTADVVEEFEDIIGDAQVEFRLPTLDPEGNCTNGINYIKTHENFNADNFSKIHQWPRSKYLNVWVVNSIASGTGGTTLGFAIFPSASQGNNRWLDGIVIRNDAVGSIGTSNDNRPTTLTHEVGHWLALAHTWGPGNSPGTGNCDDDDGIEDTPNCDGTQGGCPLDANTCIEDTLDQIDNIQNYMEYTADFCQHMFTEGQASLMQLTLNSSVSFRNNLWSEANLEETGVFAETVCVPEPEYHVERKFVCQGDEVEFNAFPRRAPVDEFEWTFEGGSPSEASGSSPTVTYDSPGWKEVTLTVSNSQGSETLTVEEAIYVYEGEPFYGEEIEEFTEDESYSEWFSVNESNDATAWQLIDSAGFLDSKSWVLNNYQIISNPIANFHFNRLGKSMDALVTPAFDLSDAEGKYFKFRYSASTIAPDPGLVTDEIRILVSIDCGPWLNRGDIEGLELVLTGGGAGDFYKPTGLADWGTKTIEIGSFEAESHVRFRIEYHASDFASNVYLDNIGISADPSSLDEVDNSFGMKVFPNPAGKGDVINVAFEGTGEEMDLRVMDVTGRLVTSRMIRSNANRNTYELDITDENLTSGMYMLTLSDGKRAQTVKLSIK